MKKRRRSKHRVTTSPNNHPMHVKHIKRPEQHVKPIVLTAGQPKPSAYKIQATFRPCFYRGDRAVPLIKF